MRGDVREPTGSGSGNGYKILSESEICDCLWHWGFVVDDQMQIRQPGRTVNAANPVLMSGDLSDPAELLSEAVPRPEA